MRGDDNEAENEETLELSNKYLVKDGEVIAVDLAGAEALYSTMIIKKFSKKEKIIKNLLLYLRGRPTGLIVLEPRLNLVQNK